MSNAINLSQENVAKRFSDALYEAAKANPDTNLTGFIGHLSDKTGVEERTIRSYLAGTSSGMNWRGLAIMRELGSAFINRNLDLIGYGHVIALDIRDLTPDGNRTMAVMASEMNELATAMMDRHLSREECRDLGPRFRQLAKEMNDFAASCEIRALGCNS